LTFELLVFDSFDFSSQHLALRDGDLLVAALARLGAAQQLPRPLAGDDDELKPILLWCSFQLILAS
jgi:hypothetical protein